MSDKSNLDSQIDAVKDVPAPPVQKAEDTDSVPKHAAAVSDQTGLWGMTDHIYDQLVRWARAYLPTIAAILAILAGCFSQLSQVPGLQDNAPWIAMLAGVLAAVSTALNKILQVSKAQYTQQDSVQ
ncbi:MAG: hypothetical protein [Bacteriophage sp.]|nr:MAG: hypothetical protein [Bacteriophage sp.]